VTIAGRSHYKDVNFQKSFLGFSELSLRMGPLVFNGGSAAMAAVALLAATALAQDPPYPFLISRPDLAVVGEEATLACALTIEDIPSAKCKWEKPDGLILMADMTSGEVTDDAGSPVEGYEAFGNRGGPISPQARVCGLTVAAVAAEDLGQWSCVLNDEEPDRQFHRGTFQLIDDGYLQDVSMQD
jgi:hypothetical protein